MDPKVVMDRDCPNCKSFKPGRKSDCEIRKALYYNLDCSNVFRIWAEGQVFSGACKQRRRKK